MIFQSPKKGSFSLQMEVEMRCLFTGVGEAFDELLPNCSVLVNSGATLLMDCGYTVPASFWRLAERPSELDAVWISHFHGDHYFGLTALLLRLHEEQRQRPLILVSQPGLEERLIQCLDLAYSTLRRRMDFPLHFLIATPGSPLRIGNLLLECARSEHSQPNCALRVTDGRASLFYSGDGRPTPETLALARGVDLVIHESYSLEESMEGHSSISGSIDFSSRAGARSLAIVHVKRDHRHQQKEEIRRLLAGAPSGLQTFLPEPGESLELG